MHLHSATPSDNTALTARLGSQLELAPEAGYRVEEGVYTLDHLAGAEEAFTSSSIREVVPVVELDGRAVGTGMPGAAARVLQTALRALATRSG